NLDFTFLGTVTGSPTGGNAGNITVETNTLVGNNGGQIVSLAADFLGFGTVRGNTGNVNVTATDSISVTGIGPDDFTISGFGSSVLFGAMGDGGSVTLQTGSLTISEGAQVRTSTQGEGNAGRIEINASDSITIDGAVLSALGPNPSGILSEVLPGAMGQGNEIVISTGNLSVSNGGFISASTNADGAAGNVTITATNAASFAGAPGEPFDPSGAFVGTLEDAAGDGGILTITTPSLSVTDGAQLEAETRGVGNAGNINLNVSDTVLVDGTDSAIQANTTEDSMGMGGDVIIDPRPRLAIVQNGGRIAVDSQGTGTGGNIEITATELRLDQGEITAGADSTDGGDITLDLGPLLVLRNGSNISATAGRDQGFGNGGNVAITTADGFVVAVDTENSDITANAFLGNGGNVTVNTQGLFGIEFRPALTPLSDITASSEFGLQGSVTIETPDVDPSDDLVQLPTGLVDASRLVAQGCGAGASDIATALGEFTVTGRGGLPPSPEQLNPQNDLAVWETLDDAPNTPTTATSQGSVSSTVNHQEPIQITEFQGWIVDDNGEIVLTAEARSVTPHSPWQSVSTCQTQG
ncbi:MAG: S-layer family protein, partial [Cyanobacteria bacterium P01_F01_bin.116]